MVRCPSCGEENTDRAKFCSECGTTLLARRLPAEERKVVTVLFCDLVDFTARSDNADPEDVRATLSPYHQRLRSEIERFGGTVEKFIGDAVMAVFGAPVAHEDDAERAVRAGLRMLAAIEELNAGPGLELAVRIGVATGETVVALGARPERGEGIVTGDVVNTAARLQTVAPIGGLVVGDLTWRATRAVVEYEPLPPVTVKGKAEPVPIHRALAARSRAGAHVPLATTPFVGREYELQAAQTAYARALRECSTQLVTIVGEPGVGKSRLVGELFCWVDDQAELVQWREGRCLPYGASTSFWALGEVVKDHAGILESDEPPEAAAKLAAAVAAVSADDADRQWLTSRLAPLVGLPDSVGATREELFAAWLRFFEVLAAQAPLVLVVEDLQWADRALLDFVEHLLEWSTGVPLVVIGTARPELYEGAPGWGGGPRNTLTIGLAPLDEAETAQLLWGLLDGAALPADVTTLLVQRSGGNPLYAQEFVRMLLDLGLLDGDHPSRDLDGPELLGFPHSIQALVAARLDTLSADAKRLLQDAAVVGQVFWSGAVSALAGVPERDVRATLHDLARRDLVRPVRLPSVAGQAEYAFSHALIRDVTYGQLPRVARSQRHRAAAEWIESMAGDDQGSTAEVVAHHLTTAHDLAAKANDAAALAALAEPAARALVRAGDRAANLDTAAAGRHYETALGLLSLEHSDRPAVLVKAGQALATEAWDRAQVRYEEAIAAFEERGDAPGAGIATIRLSDLLYRRGETVRSLQLVRSVIGSLEPAHAGPALATAYGKAAFNALMAARYDEALDLAVKALAIDDATSESRQEALTAKGLARLLRGDSAGVDDLRESIDFAAERGSNMDLHNAKDNMAEAIWVTDSAPAGLAAYDAAIELADRYGLRVAAVESRCQRARVMFDIGAWDELESTVSETSEWLRSQGGGYYDVMQQPYLAAVRSWRGEPAGTDFLSAAREIGDLQVLLPALILAGLVHGARDEHAEALALVAELEAGAASTDTWFRCLNLADAARVAVAAGDTALVRRLVDAVSPSALRHRLAHRTAQAVLAEACGDLAASVATYEEVADGWRAYGHRLEHGLALLGAGRCRSRLDRPAGTELGQAREVFAGLGARPLLVQIDREMARAPG